MPVELKRLRSAAELAQAAADLKRNGYTQGVCGYYSNEQQRCEASGSAWDRHCPHCGSPMDYPLED